MVDGLVLLPLSFIVLVDSFVVHFAGIAQSLHQRCKRSTWQLQSIQVSEGSYGCARREIPVSQFVEIDLEQLARELIIILCDVVRIVFASAIAEPKNESIEFRRPA